MESISQRLLDVHKSISAICWCILNSRDHSTLFEEICRILVDRKIYHAASIGLVDRELAKIRTAAHCGLEEFPAEFELSNTPNILTSDNYVCNNIGSRTDLAPWLLEAQKHHYTSAGIFPIRIANSLVATIMLYSREENTFLPEELDAIQILAKIISVALAHLRLDEQKKNAEIQLQRDEAVYSRIINKMFELVCAIDNSGQLIFVNNPQKRVLGFGPEDMLGKTFLEFLHPDDANTFDKALRAAAQSRSIEMMELRFKRSKGKHLWLELTGDALIDDDDRVSGFVLTGRDVTERKRSLERLEKYTRDLEEQVEERTEKIKGLNKTITERLVQKINQINNISKIRDQLKKNPGGSSNFELIVDGAIRDLGMDAAGIFSLNSHEQTVEAKCLRPIKESCVRTTYPLSRPFLEFDSINNNQTISRTVGNEPCILGTRTIHCAPISFANRVYGVLALGSNSREMLDESDLSVLSLYSGLVTTALETATLTIEPTKELNSLKGGRRRLDFGISYLIPDNVELAYELFLEIVLSGIEGLCITRTMPRRVRERYGLKRTPIVCLTDETIGEERTIQSLQDVSILVSNYVQKAKQPVILIDGIEYLISHMGFDSVYHFMQAKRTQMEANQGILIIPFFRDAIEPKEARLLEREFRVFSIEETARTMKNEVFATMPSSRPIYGAVDT